jgi:hypothetical protein
MFSNFLDAVRRFRFERAEAELEGLRDVRRGDLVALGQVGDRPRYPQQAVEASRGEAGRVDGPPQERLRLGPRAGRVAQPPSRDLST